MAKKNSDEEKKKVTFLIVVLVALALLAAAVLSSFIYMWYGAKRKENLAETDWGKLKDRATYLQSLITVMALIVGACWVLFTWKIQWEDHLQSQKEIHQKTELTELAGLQINISAHQEWPEDADSQMEFFIAGDIVFKNAGVRGTKIRMADGPLFVSLVKASKIGLGTTEDLRNLSDRNRIQQECLNGRAEPEPPQRFWLSRPSADQRPNVEVQDEIRPGEEDQFHFIVRVKHVGTYAIMFSSEIPDEERAQPMPKDLGACVQGGIPLKPRWESAAAFVEVTSKKKKP